MNKKKLKVKCIECHTVFLLDESLVKIVGSRVRCPGCKKVFKVCFKEKQIVNAANKFLKNCALIDLEIDRNNKIRHMGAILGDSVFEKKGVFSMETALKELDSFCKDAVYLLGHNVLFHDLPALAKLSPGLKILRRPVIDTLHLSPLAFPENPYHKLIKGYKLVRSSRNNPVEDARLGGELFLDQFLSFAQFGKKSEDILAFYGFCFSSTENDEQSRIPKHANLFHSLGVKEISLSRAWEIFQERAKGLACPNHVEESVFPFLENTRGRQALAYVLSWLRVAGGNSILPPWVNYTFTHVGPIIQKLRSTPCHREDCPWCSEIHNPVFQLKKYFSFDAFRALPSGEQLQEELVARGMADRPTLGILPTGFGKSICYQLPALVRFYRTGALTIVISPLQALMKDQVDNLKASTNTNAVAAIYGLLTLPERGAVMERIRLGDIGLLYISPEQLRNNSVREVLKHRKIGCWVFDEAHCLSKWGHDFRPDYLYTARFIREFSKKQGRDAPPVACFTATARPDVIREITDHFKEELGQELLVSQGGVERENLHFEVQTVRFHEKPERVRALLDEKMEESGCAVVYCATRKNTEKMAEYLGAKGIKAEAFHGGLRAPAKQRILEGFISEENPVICATNAFGMGIDKDNVRLVIHADIPGSLENYLQEAGRAGRDKKEADCILLYDEEDIETQFRLGALSQLGQRDIAEILRGLRHADKKKGGEIIITTGELLRDDSLATGFDGEDRNSDTKVKAAVAWLEKAGYLQRNENRTRVFQGRPKVKSGEELKEKLKKFDLPEQTEKIWERILISLLQCDPDDGMSADELAEALGRIQGINPENIPDTKGIIHILNQMAEKGLIKRGLLLTAYVKARGKNHARETLGRFSEMDTAMIGILREEHPDETVGEWVDLNLTNLNQKVADRLEKDINPETLKILLLCLAQDGKGIAGSKGSIVLRHAFRDIYKVKLQRNWRSITKTAEKRRNLAHVILSALHDRIPKNDKKKQLFLVEFSVDDLADAVKRDMTVDVAPGSMLAAIDRGLLFLHEIRAIILQQGLSVFRQALTIKILPEAHGRRYNKGDFKPLSHHYNQRRIQVHVMNEYARMGVKKISQALNLVAAYFSMGSSAFIKEYFSKREKLLQMAAGEASFKQIVESLKNPIQESITASPTDDNILILAGPGSGKTRTVIHRCAYLLRIERVHPKSLLVLCFNYSAALSIKKRLRDLVGRDSGGVMVMTYHALAMRLTGTSFSARMEKTAGKSGNLTKDFDEIIRDATMLLKGEKELPGVDSDEVRDRLLAGYRHILVDEYQDIDDKQYELISALAGRSLNESSGKLSIMAVGDDDQSIYGFRNASVRFIRKFKEDYEANVFHLVENYRSTAHIINASNSLINHNRDRMKTDHPIRIDKWRMNAPEGEAVRLLAVKNPEHQGEALVREIQRIKEKMGAEGEYGEIAVLARNGMKHPELALARASLEELQIPLSFSLERDASFPLVRVREIALLLEELKGMGNKVKRASELRDLFFGGERETSGPWNEYALKLLTAWEMESANAPCKVESVVYFLYEAIAEQKRERRLGDGVFLSTVHGVKGLEFSHIVILDGAWRRPDKNADMEEERRLFYVGMTRAKESLTLFKREDCNNPHTPLLNREHVNDEWAEGSEKELARKRGKRYTVLGMKDIYLDYAAGFHQSAPIHRALANLKTGDPLFMKTSGDSIILMDEGNRAVARLSGYAAPKWRGRMAAISRISVLAVLKRYKKDTSPEYLNRIKCEEWEIPMAEITTDE